METRPATGYRQLEAFTPGDNIPNIIYPLNSSIFQEPSVMDSWPYAWTYRAG